MQCRLHGPWSSCSDSPGWRVMSLTTFLLFFGGQLEDRECHDARRPRYFMLLSVAVVFGGLALVAVVKVLLDFFPGQVADAKFDASGDPALRRDPRGQGPPGRGGGLLAAGAAGSDWAGTQRAFAYAASCDLTGHATTCSSRSMPAAREAAVAAAAGATGPDLGSGPSAPPLAAEPPEGASCGPASRCRGSAALPRRSA